MKTRPTPPNLFLKFFRWFCHPNLVDHIEGDLLEDYGARIKKSGKGKADIQFMIDVLLLFRPGIIRPTEGHKNLNTYGMYKSYFKIGWRNILRNKGFSFINIGGLAVGMACFSIIVLYAEYELSYDRFHRNPNDIYRVVKDFVNEDGSKIPDATTPPALAKALREELSEVEQATRFFPNRGRLFLLEYGDKRFYETEVIRVDNYFFDVFDFPFILGSKETARMDIHSIVLTETAAKKYFGNEDPINKVIRIDLNNGTDFTVRGILKDVPQNSHFKFDVLIPFESTRNPDENWDFNSFYTYARLESAADPVAFESRVKTLVKKYKPNSTDQYYLQHLLDIHLKSNLKWELSANGDLLNIKIMMIIGLFVIVVASTNYVNLVTSQSGKRAREIGVRKVAGASKGILRSQFLVESVLASLTAFSLSVVLVLCVLPLLRPVLGYDLSAFFPTSYYFKLIMPCIVILVGVLAGIFPAFYMSGLQPSRILKGAFLSSTSGVRVRRGLVVLQFIISSGLIVGTLVVIQQLDFLKQKQLGFEKENILLLPNVSGGIGGQATDPAVVVNELKKIPNITRIARADGILGANNSVNGIGKKNNESHIALNFIRADYEFLPVMQIKLTEGRNFSEEFASDSLAIILNETAVAQLGLEKPYIGQQLSWDDVSGSTHLVTLIGIVEDFHFSSLRDVIKPFGFILEVGNGGAFFLKVQSQNMNETISAIEQVWGKLNPEKPFEFSFQDEQVAKFHSSEARFKYLFSLFATMSILITCLGMFGLVAYQAETKTKEIGVRKVLGASVRSIVLLLSRDFIIMALIGFAISFPLAYNVMEGWLQGFAYRNEIGLKVFVVSAFTLLIITLATVSFQSVKAALVNPVKSLRAE
jgi:putative ABC transport system permease protein